jgi:hypothetical protein
MPATVRDGKLTERGKSMVGFSSPAHSLTTGLSVGDVITDNIAFNLWQQIDFTNERVAKGVKVTPSLVREQATMLNRVLNFYLSTGYPRLAERL